MKGGIRATHGDKGFGDVLNGAAIEYLMCARRDLILDTESYYGGLQLAKDTKWYSFITDVWTKVLIKERSGRSRLSLLGSAKLDQSSA